MLELHPTTISMGIMLMHCIFRKKNLGWIGSLVILMAILFLCACQSEPKSTKCYPQQKCINEIAQTLSRYNVAVIQVGETVSIHIPAGQLFNENTANFTGNYRII